MEEHLWTSSFWRLLSNCSDSRKLLILQKIILHKLGNKPDFSNNLNKIINNHVMPLPKDKQDTQTSVKPIKTYELRPINKQQSVISQSNAKNEENTAKVRVAPVMGTNALLAKYKNCVETPESKIVAHLVNTKFNKEYEVVDKMQNMMYDLDLFTTETTTPLTFDEDKFLEDALGDEINSFISTEFECPESEFQDEDTIELPEQSVSISSSRISSLISTATSIYTSLKKRARRPTSSPCTEPKPNIHPVIANTEVDLMLQEASIQHQIIVEACKALNVCLSSKEFLFGPEHIEAERILLLAMYKQNTVLKEMKKLKYDLGKSTISRGYVDISHLQFPVLERTQKEGYMNWFVAIVSCGGSVFATNAVDVDDKNIVQFQESFKFENLQHDFEIDVSIYSLLAKSNANNYYSNLKQHSKDEETVTCLTTPEKLLCRRNSIKRRKQHCFERREPSFKLWGKTTINISNAAQSSPFQLEQIPSGTTLKGFVLMDFNTLVEFEENHSEFLTLRTECDNYMAWNLRWCNLIGHTLFYWNYPADQDSTEPIGKIILQHCITSEISEVDRNLCARPRTLLVETMETSDQGTLFVRHFLSADNTEKMLFWKNRLNEVLSELIKWNMMKCKVQLI